MKKASIIIGCLLLGACCHSLSGQLPEEVILENVDEGAQIAYLSTSQMWVRGSMADDQIVCTRKVSSGTGSYSEYACPNQNIGLSSTQEFIINGRLIGYSAHTFKFYEIDMKNRSMESEELAVDEVRSLFPNIRIVPISDVEKGVLTIRRCGQRPEDILLMNDTPADFYHYSFDPPVNAGTPFKSILTTTIPQTVVLSHFDENTPDYPALKIQIR